MIEKGKLYLCVRNYVKTQLEKEREEQRNQFIDAYYYATYNSYSIDRGGRVFIPSFCDTKPNPTFFVGSFYGCVTDGYLTDSFCNPIEITEENYDTFVEFTYDITPEAQRMIDIMSSKDISISISPYATMKEEAKEHPTGTINDFAITWQITMTLTKIRGQVSWASGAAYSETQEEGILKAWKSLRIRSSLACRIRESVLLTEKKTSWERLNRYVQDHNGTFTVHYG